MSGFGCWTDSSSACTTSFRRGIYAPPTRRGPARTSSRASSFACDAVDDGSPLGETCAIACDAVTALVRSIPKGDGEPAPALSSTIRDDGAFMAQEGSRGITTSCPSRRALRRAGLRDRQTTDGTRGPRCWLIFIRWPRRARLILSSGGGGDGGDARPRIDQHVQGDAHEKDGASRAAHSSALRVLRSVRPAPARSRAVVAQERDAQVGDSVDGDARAAIKTEPGATSASGGGLFGTNLATSFIKPGGGKGRVNTPNTASNVPPTTYASQFATVWTAATSSKPR